MTETSLLCFVLKSLFQGFLFAKDNLIILAMLLTTEFYLTFDNILKFVKKSLA